MQVDAEARRAADRLDRDRVPRRRRRGVRGRAPRRAKAASPCIHQFSERFECRRCGIAYEDPQPRLFSFNNPFGACPTCHGFGNVIELDMDLVVPDPTKSIRQGAIEPWTQAALPLAAGRAEAGGQAAGHSARRAVEAS